MPSNGDIRERMDLPPDSVIDIEMEVVGVVNDQGELEMRFRCETSTASSASAIGLLDQAKFLLLKEWDLG